VSTTGYTVQFNETAANEGTYESTPSNIMMKDTNSVLPMTGKYWLVGNQLIVSCANPAGGMTGFAWRVDVARGGHEMTFADGTVATRLTRAAVAE
jgi:hypothetical protein